MQTEIHPLEPMSAKLIACAVVVACLALGVIGLILPILPGLLFLAIAVLVAAKYFPALERALRQSTTLGGYLDRAEGFAALSLGDKVRLGALLSIKMLIDGFALLVAGVMKLVRAAERT